MKEGSGKGRNICLVTLGVVIAFVLVMVILGLTVFKPRKTITNVDSIKLQDMNMGIDVFGMGINMNVTLDVDVSVKNTNKFGFKYTNSVVQVKYREKLIGEAPIPNGEILPDETMGLNLTLTVMADRLFDSYAQASMDVIVGTLPLNTFMKISGEVIILGFIKIPAESSSSCDFIINISTKKIVDNKCQHTTKI